MKFPRKKRDRDRDRDRDTDFWEALDRDRGRDRGRDSDRDRYRDSERDNVYFSKTILQLCAKIGTSSISEKPI